MEILDLKNTYLKSKFKKEGQQKIMGQDGIIDTKDK